MFKRNKVRDMIHTYQRLFKTPDGEKVLKDLMQSCFITSSTFDPDPQKQAFNEGVRSVTLRIMRTINVSEKALNNMMKQMEEQDEFGSY